MPTITIESARAVEGGFTEFTLRLSEPATDAVRVQYAVVPGMAGLEDLDRFNGGAPFTGEVIFLAGETFAMIRIKSRSDRDDELDESFFLELRNPEGATFGDNVHSLSAVGWVQDDPDDGVGNNRAIAVSDPVITEAGGGKAVFTVSLSQAFDTDTSFSFSTFDGSAKAGSDYAAVNGTVTFLAGQTEATVEVSLLNNNLAEATERFGLAITGAHGVTGAVGTAHVLDTDGARPVLSIEGARAVEGGFTDFTVRLSEAATDAVTVQYAVVPGTAGLEDLDRFNGGASFTGEVVLLAGETVQTIRIKSRSDRDDELDQGFFVELRNPVNATFGSGNGSLTATGWVLDDDGPFLNRTVAVAGANISEGPGGRFAVFAVEISTPHTAPLTLNYQTVNGTARAGSDYAASSGQITFAAGQTRAEVSVRIIDDLMLESSEQFYLRVAPPFPSAISASSNMATGSATINDGSLRGTAGSDILRGTAAADAIAGLAGNDRILGLRGNDRLWGDAGDDTLNGGAGADTLIGGQGKDSYVIDRFDTVVEARNGGIDTVYAAFTTALGANVEWLVLTGSGNINGTGNALNNVLTGNAGRNVLGGGAGNDTYVVGAGDRVIEGLNGGIDTVRSSVAHVLAANVEHLVLTGSGNIGGTGNGLANRLTGNSGNNVLSGGAGADTLFGGLGADTLAGGADSARDVFVFNRFADFGRGSAVDQVVGFVSGIDRINLSALDAHTGRAGNQDFAFGGTSARANAVWYERDGGSLMVRGDHTGDGRADFAFVIRGENSLDRDDFIF